jgi:hypothetical protein
MKLWILTLLIAGIASAHDGVNTRELEDRYVDVGHFHIPIDLNLNGDFIIDSSIPVIGGEDRKPENFSFSNLLIGVDIFSGLIRLRRQYSRTYVEHNNSNVVIPSNPNDGYWYYKKLNYSLGIGQEFRIELPIGGFITFGVTPIAGRAKIQKRIVNADESITLLKNLRIPFTHKRFNEWRSGESLKYGVIGGILVSGGVKVPIAGGIGVVFATNGHWNYTISKKENTLVASIEKGRVHSISTGIENTALHADIGRYWTKSNGFQFIFNYDYPSAAKYFKWFVAGNIKKVLAASDDPTSGVSFVEQNSINNTGNAYQATLKIPLLGRRSVNRNKEKREFFFQTRDALERYWVTEKRLEKESRGVISKHKVHSVSISSIAYKEEQYKGDRLYNTNLKFHCAYQKDSVKIKKLKKVLKRCLKKIGLKDIQLPLFPKSKHQYLKAILSLSINAQDLLKVIGKKAQAALYREDFESYNSIVVNWARKTFKNKRSRDTFYKTIKKGTLHLRLSGLDIADQTFKFAL